MKKFLLIGATLMLLLSACSAGSYDQKKVDQLLENKEAYTANDYQTMIDQVGYALDDAEKAGNFEKWASENEEECQALMGLGLALQECAEADSNFPASKKDEVKKLMARWKKIIEKSMSVAMPVDEVNIYDSAADTAVLVEETVVMEEVVDSVDGGYYEVVE